MSDTKNKTEFLRILKFTFFSISAGLIQIGSFTLMNEVLHWDYWVGYIISLVLSVLWNFTFNRKFTFHSAANVPVAMIKVLCYYAVFTPLSTLLENYLTTTAGWNEYLVTLMNMVINFVTEFLYQKFFVFRNTIDSTVNWSVTVYVCDDFCNKDGDIKEESKTLLDCAERGWANKIQEYSEEKDKLLSATSYMLLEKAVKEKYKREIQEKDLILSESGKPYVKRNLNNEDTKNSDADSENIDNKNIKNTDNVSSDIYFNISHCKSAAACAVYNKEVGIDVQEIRKIKESTKQVLTDKEKALTEKNPQLFFKFWAAKESFVKQNGKGVGALGDAPDFSGFNKTKFRAGGLNFFCKKIKDYYMCICSCGDTFAVNIHKVKFKDLANEK